MTVPLKTCFVISPIGPESSDIRKDADDLLELVIEPALQAFQFQVIRADKIAGSGAITSDIIALVQNAELCVIDLTNQNSNVYYECGRRHETGKPFIQLLRTGDTLPFDVAGIRTILYDLSTPRSVNSAVKALKTFVDAFQAEDFVTTASGGSIASVGETLDRVERKIDRLVSSISAREPSDSLRSTSPFGPAQMFGRAKLSSRKAFMLAAARQDREGVVTTFQQLAQELRGDENRPELLNAATLAASNGSELGAVLLLEFTEREKWFDEIDGLDKNYVLGSLVSFYNATDREDEGIARLLSLLTQAYNDTDSSPKSRAYAANQIQKLYSGKADGKSALVWINRATELTPDEWVYHMNASMVYEALELWDSAETEIRRALDLMDPPSIRVLEQAIDIFWQLEKLDEGDRLIEELARLDAAAAELKWFERPGRLG